VSYGNSWLQATLEPDLSFAQNLDYETIGDPTKDDWWGLDRPQRFGTEPRIRLGWGESDLRTLAGDWTVGLSTETVVLGPGEQNNLVLGRNAAGFPHVDLGTLRGWETGWGTWELRFLWGLTSKTEYYDSSANPFNLIQGVSLGWSPPFAPGLELGINRYYTQRTSTLTVASTFQVFSDTLFRGGGDDLADQLISFCVDYSPADRSMRLYAEVSKNDSESNLVNTLQWPERSMNWLWGGKWTWSLAPSSALTLQTEWADLGLNRTDYSRGTGSIYRHVPNFGWTNEGKVMGAGIGPGSNSQWVALGWTDGRIDLGLSVERVGLDNDYLYQVVMPTDPANSRHNLYFDWAATGAWNGPSDGFQVEVHLIAWYDRNWANTSNWTYGLAGDFGYHWGLGR
jgi:hypothetical protein